MSSASVRGFTHSCRHATCSSQRWAAMPPDAQADR
jgi:hypothetical protein